MWKLHCLWFPTPLGYTFCSFHARDSRLTREARETTKKSATNNFVIPPELKYVFWLEENVSRVIGQNFMTPWGEHNSVQPQGNNNLDFRLVHDLVVQFWNRGKFVCQPRQANNFYAVMAAKRFQTRTEEEIEQLLHDKSSKSTNKATDNAVRTWLFNEVFTFVT